MSFTRAHESIRIPLIAAAIATLLSACGGSKSSSTGNGGSGAPSGSAGSGGPGTGTTGALACSDLFDQSMVRTYSIDIAPDVMASIQAEFHDTASLLAQGNDFVSRHSVVFHMGSETVSDATFKLHGQSSWLHTVMLDGDHAKMQFDVSFHQSDPNGNFHGV